MEAAAPAEPFVRTGWIAYFVVAIAVTLLYWSVAWLEGTLPAHAGMIHVILPLFAFAGLPALTWFNALARRALASARPLLKVDSAGYELLTYRLTTMPAWLAIVAAAIGLLSLAGLTIWRPPDTFNLLRIMVTPTATVIEWILQFMTWTGVGVVGVEIARKLWVIDDTYKNHMQINVLRPGALSAFSRLAAAMVVFTLAGVVLAAVAFVAPLWGGHRSMAREKARNLLSVLDGTRTLVVQAVAKAGVSINMTATCSPI